MSHGNTTIINSSNLIDIIAGQKTRQQTRNLRLKILFIKNLQNLYCWYETKLTKEQ